MQFSEMLEIGDIVVNTDPNNQNFNKDCIVKGFVKKDRTESGYWGYINCRKTPDEYLFRDKRILKDTWLICEIKNKLLWTIGSPLYLNTYYKIIRLKKNNDVIKEEYPHVCPFCNGPAYIPLMGLPDCKNKCQL